MEKHSLALPELRQVAHKMRAAGLGSIELSGKDWKVRLHYNPGPPQLNAKPPALPATVSLPDAPASTAVVAPIPGKILLQHPLNGVAFARAGQQVKQDEVLALVQVGYLYLPVTSPADGTLTSIAVTQDQPVEYGSEVAQLNIMVNV
ncbi:acetyl-CoA carboxylase biotin carboxyl carrier protein subunit [Pantoea sp. Bo_2]|uniref:Acetyl-CoA carboxylase biotin carboxyl carrier protein subunit n=1 Tax=Candidatus Pantoea gossypiicola TaxID=2608008 RepID=A0AB34CIV6_9GAMM|nr:MULTISPECIES: biotin/lipoyl-containing protein [Pantoea]KAA5928055.1 acetyl-CoA carboxylase biotin carboxyl carrier protein subunit [Pantoea sp. VH_8]KAA5934172.1 acetyl-CoA carboxylase biotin carboxyl carrier protein subunit [Pantoea sp. VH_4]KAA5941648.1 acetyl-CoA carboxylase biotin carboxyl carrier protein subunit [Pantoea sp. VH_3]KAA5949512.1 acetyl-CoA carboxylase biotin carboxyl carrier protein subunit [Pantoea sp. VH_25]KAA5956002.1 acetyl-CoA carboxylase biotin carboxyl carrier pr